MQGPSPLARHPIAGAERVGFLKNFITRPNIEVGDYSYYDDPNGVDQFEKNVLYHFDFVGDRLVIGRFCSIAAETRFIMNGGNHATDWFTTFPFPVFGHGWEEAMPESWPNRPDARQTFPRHQDDRRRQSVAIAVSAQHDCRRHHIH